MDIARLADIAPCWLTIAAIATTMIVFRRRAPAVSRGLLGGVIGLIVGGPLGTTLSGSESGFVLGFLGGALVGVVAFGGAGLRASTPSASPIPSARGGVAAIAGLVAAWRSPRSSSTSAVRIPPMASSSVTCRPYRSPCVRAAGRVRGSHPGFSEGRGPAEDELSSSLTTTLARLVRRLVRLVPGWVFADGAVGLLAQQVEVADVSPGLFDHVQQIHRREHVPASEPFANVSSEGAARITVSHRAVSAA